MWRATGSSRCAGFCGSPPPPGNSTFAAKPIQTFARRGRRRMSGCRRRSSGPPRQELRRLWREEVWLQLNREGFKVGRDRVARLMAQLGLEGVVRGKVARTTTPDKAAACPFDLVKPPVPCAGAEHALGFGLHLRLDLGRYGLCGLRHRRLRQADRWMAGQP